MSTSAARWRQGLGALLGLLCAAGCSPGSGPAPALPADGAVDAKAASKDDAAAEPGAAGEGKLAAAASAGGEGDAGKDAAAADGGDDEPTPEPTRSSLSGDEWLAALLAKNADIAHFMEDPEQYRLQVLVTLIEPDGSTRTPLSARSKATASKTPPAMTEHGYRVDVEYVYPASAIKTFAAVSALRKLEGLRKEGHPVGLDTPVALCAGGKRGCKTKDESNVEGGVITLGHEIRKMQLVSNNFSFNRLYDFVGHRELNEDLWALGFASMRMHHRLYSGSDPLEQKKTPRIELRPVEGKRVVIPARTSTLSLPATKAKLLKIGKGYIDDATHSRVDEPMDFADKNYVSVRDLHRLTLALCRPDLPGVPDLALAPADRDALISAMTEDPLASKNPVYTDENASGLRYHTMIKGMLRRMPLERILYTGKAGKAYGFHLDNAYIEDLESGRAMVVTVVGYANADGVLNDNVYEYDTVTRRLLLGLGELLASAVLLGEGLPSSDR